MSPLNLEEEVLIQQQTTAPVTPNLVNMSLSSRINEELAIIHGKK